MDLLAIERMARRWWLMIGGLAIVGALAAGAVSTQLPRVYEAHATLLVGRALLSDRVGLAEMQAAEALAQTYVQLVPTETVLTAAAERLGVDSDTLADRVTARSPVSSPFVEISARGPSAAGAAALANAVADTLRAGDLLDGADGDLSGLIAEELEVNRQAIEAAEAELAALLEVEELTPEQRVRVPQLEGLLADLRATRATLLATSTSGPNVITVVDRAAEPDGPIAPRVMVNVALGGVIGGVSGILLAYILELRERYLATGKPTRRWAGRASPLDR